MFGRKPNFAWITLDIYRHTIAEDFREAKICHARGAYKACIIMLGAVIEALLSYALRRLRIDFPDNASLKQLIDIARSNAVLPPGEIFLGQAIRDYRNLVHPDKELADKCRPDHEAAATMMQAGEYVLAKVKDRLAGCVPVAISASLLIDGKVIPVHNVPFTLGRADDNGHVIASPSVSGHHAQIDFAGNSFWLRDMRSTNGTFVVDNGQPRKVKSHQPVSLSAGMEFRLGRKAQDTTVVFLVLGEARTALE